ncbi:MAG: YigZ family protein [Daejeonella sp.]|uniref:IMPACT family protein n=1 Tax=Daejeonella sp. TaxID=2805397 RepID=UPI0027326828|nr:YigZ family protein [Daejeonella sp.]MDP3468222.1 YigZ family protein [Daejeonella sp.]
MLFDDTYKTIQELSEGIYRDKGSKFISYLYPVSSENDIKDLINALKSEHPKARHHCWALRLSPDKTVFRLNDDGEPSGTAGRPILNTLLSNELTNILAVVVRYFGGTLLGVPGLINAYKSATIEAVNNAKIIEKTVNSVFRIEFSHPQMNEVMKIVKEEELTINNQNFDLSCSFLLEIRQSKVNKVLGKLEKVDGLKWK